MANETPDPDLLRSGDTTAFGKLYADLAPRVLGYLLRLTGGNRSEAEDLTQETFLAAYANRQHRSGASAIAWLLGIARRRQRDASRAAGSRPASVSLPSVHEASVEGTPLDETVVRRAALIEALDRLDTAERDAVLLVIVQGLTYTEAARVIGEPVGTVKWRVHQATGRLRKLLSGAFAEESAIENPRKEPEPYVRATANS